MIYTLTPNPSLDYVVNVKNFTQGKVNRTASENLYAGGKGINISIVLNSLGYSSMALGFIAGTTGDAIEGLFGSYGCTSDFIRVSEGANRINVKIHSKKETEINGSGIEVNQNEVDKLYGKLDNLGDGDVLVLAGSVPKSLSSKFYENILKTFSGRNIKFVVDAEDKLLMNVLKYKPFLIKPNLPELEQIFKVKINSREEVAWYAKQLRDKGAQNVLVSLGGDGAVLITEDGRALYSPVPEGEVLNSVGAGDSMIAGFLAGFFNTGDIDHAFKLGLAAGSATAFSPWLATAEEINALL